MSRPSLAAAAALSIAIVLTGCGGGPPKRARDVRPAVVRDLPAVLRGTIGSETTLVRIQPQLISGYGLVVGLRGTGGGALPERVEVSMERELGLRGVGAGNEMFRGTPFEGMTPRQLLRHPDVAVVVVYAAMPPGAPNGAKFDVYVKAVNGGGLTSLEGGTLWTTELRLGPPSAYGTVQARQIGIARGPIFVNPFAEPSQGETFGRTTGRVLDGGMIVNSSNFELRLDNTSHSRARAIQEAILNHFPEGPGDSGPAARGRSASVIEVVAPRAYLDRAQEFTQLLAHTQIDPTAPEEYARKYAEALKTQPGLATPLSWCLQAIGRPALPFLRELYDEPEMGPRLAALRAGAGLGDPRAALPLKSLAQTGPAALRPEAIEMLGRLDAGPTVDVALRDLLAEPSLEVRVAAYEALADRAERLRMAQWYREMEARPAAARVADPAPNLGHMGRIALSGDTLQGVERRVMGGAFLLDLVPSDRDPLIYITQQGTPRVVVFGRDLRIRRPLMVSMWSDRLSIAADSETDDVRVFYRDPRTGQASVGRPGNSLVDLITYMARTPSPEDPTPGLGLPYSEVVGALLQLQQAGGVDAAFATERDRLMSALYKAVEGGVAEERPEFEGQQTELQVYEPVKERPAGPKPAEPGSLVEPLPPKPAGKGS
ncbi:MAG: flagellar basal body P-ring protein FlgI [Phycisphaerales bacterium]|nr:flagellar basal body P-ring protein FlgI [Phycisphaerales bacterium]